MQAGSEQTIRAINMAESLRARRMARYSAAMSEERIEAVRRVYREWAKGNFRAGPELYDPNLVLVQPPDLPESGVYLGMEGVRRYMEAFLDAWERITIEVEDIIETGDTLVAQVVQRAVGKESGIEPTELEYFQVWTFRGDRVIRLDVLRDRAEALAAAGLSE